jgi:hypothetical protein
LYGRDANPNARGLAGGLRRHHAAPARMDVFRGVVAERPDCADNRTFMHGFALFIGDHLARSVRGVPAAPPA